MDPNLDQWWTLWLPVAGACLGIATMLVGLIYMIGSMLMNDRMKGWAKLELSEIIYSAIIIAVIATPSVGLLGVVDNIVQNAIFAGYPGGGPTVWVSEQSRSYSLCGKDIAADEESMYHGIDGCHVRLGMWYMHSVFKETSDLAYKEYVVYGYTSMLADFAINFEFITEASGFFTFTPWRGFFTLGNTIKSMVFDYAIKIMILTKFQEFMLAFIAKALFPALFISGAILRTFTFSRKLGGLLLGMSISLYYIFPAFYAFGGLVMLDMKKQVEVMPSFKAICDKISKDACNDPPITNAMYVNGTIAVPGGGMNLDTYMQDYQKAEQKGVSGRMEEMNKKDSTAKPGLDLGKNLTDAEKKENMGNAVNATDKWMEELSKKSSFDSGVFIAYKSGGPVDALSRMAFFSVFFSLFGILATIAAIRSLSMTFGGDIEIAGLTHLI